MNQEEILSIDSLNLISKVNWDGTEKLTGLKEKISFIGQIINVFCLEDYNISKLTTKPYCNWRTIVGISTGEGIYV